MTFEIFRSRCRIIWGLLLPCSDEASLISRPIISIFIPTNLDTFGLTQAIIIILFRDKRTSSSVFWLLFRGFGFS